MIRVLADANVLFSAAYREDSPADLLFELARSGQCEVFMSAFAVDEARRNIQGKAPSRAPVLAHLLDHIPIVSEPSWSQLEVATKHGLPAKDAPILAAAIGCEADILVTGDRQHFGHLFGTIVAGVAIHSLAATLAKVLE